MRQERVHTLGFEWGAVMLFVRVFVGDGVNEGRQLALAPGVIKLRTCVALCLFSLSISLFPPEQQARTCSSIKCSSVS